MLRACSAASVLLFCSLALAEVPLPLAGPGCDDDDGDGFVDVIADCPNDLLKCGEIDNETSCWAAKECNWDADNSLCVGGHWDFISYIPNRWLGRMTDSVELTLGSGMHADRAWQRHTGRTDTIIAVLDSGIKWDEWDLQNKHYLNRGELPVPLDATGTPTLGRFASDNPDCPTDDPYDHNLDCVFNVQDYADDPCVHPEAGNLTQPATPLCTRPTASPATSAICTHDPFNNASGLINTDFPNTLLEPGDIICVYSDGVDDDGNGYVDDISGWDMLWDDNNPYDDTRFGHGTGEGRDSTAEGNNGGGLPGVCPNCMLLSVRAGDSFVVDANNWAAGVIFAVDSGAKVLQSAVGAITDTSFSHAAIEYAYDRGVIDIISAADETAQHQNYPGAAVEHAEYVHAVRYDAENINQATTFMNFSNCTNFGARLVLSAPSTGCSSGATGASSGVGGLIASAAAEAGIVLNGNEIHQIYVHAVDDIDLPSSQPSHADYDGSRYPSDEGWDMWFGYGRLNARKAVDMVLDGEIPPEADLLTPKWWTLVSPGDGTVEITGTARANRSTLASWVLEYAEGVDPDDSRPVDTSVWHQLATGTSPVVNDVLGTFDPSAVTFDPEARIERYNTRPELGATDDNVTKAFKVNRHTVTLRLRVTDTEGREGENRKAIYVHHDPTWKDGFPITLDASLGSAKIYDIDGNGVSEIIVADDDGYVHAFDATGGELSGWPVETNPGTAVFHPDSWAFKYGPDGIENNGDELSSDVRSSIIATPGIADLEGDGAVDVVVATLDGELYAWDASGALKSGFPVSVRDETGGSDTDEDSFMELGMFSSPALADLDGDGNLDIVVATLDQHVWAFAHDGSVVSGFPVTGAKDPADPTKPFLRLPYEGNDDGQKRRIISSPAIGDLDGDGNLEIVVGTNEAINEQISVVHAFSYDRAQQKPVAYSADCGSSPARKRCFPILMVGGYPNALPYVGEGSPASPVLADLDGDGTLEVGASSIADFGRLYHHDGFDSFDPSGSAYRELKSYVGFYGPDTNSNQASSLVMINSGAFGDLNNDGVLDYFMGAAGSNFVDNLLYDGVRADFDHQLAAWSTDTGEMLRGFPQIMEDLQFFLNPIVADVDGDGNAEVINTSATFVIHAFDQDGNQPEGWPKFTGQWQIGSPAVGDVDADGLLEMVVTTRAGWLFVYELTGRADGNVQWPCFRHDARNTGNFSTPDPNLAIPEIQRDDGSDDGCDCAGVSPPVALVLVGLALVRRRRR